VTAVPLPREHAATSSLTAATTAGPPRTTPGGFCDGVEVKHLLNLHRRLLSTCID
jgi:hypothetical protein